MNYNLVFRREALTELQTLRISNKTNYLKCFDLILSVIVDPRLGIGKPERLKYVTSKFEIYSRRINEKDRLIYLIDEGNKKVEIISCTGHYDDK